MKKILVLSIVILFVLFYLLRQAPEDNKPIVGVYPWQVENLGDGVSRVFGIVLMETRLKEVNGIFSAKPAIALYESKEKLTLEAYYKNISLGGLIGSFIFTLNASRDELEKVKRESHKSERTDNNEIKYKLDMPASIKASQLRVKNLIYIPTVQLDEEMILKRFGEPSQKIKLKTKEQGWHYLYPEKGLDLIYKKEGKEVLQYVLPRNFNALLEPLLSR